MNAQVTARKPWPRVRLEQVAEQCLGKMLDAKKNRGRPLPYLRNPNVRWFSVDTSDLQMMPFEDHEHDRYGLRAGDVVVCEGGEAGRAAIWDGRVPDMKFQKAIHRVRTGPDLLNRYLVHTLMADYQRGHLAEYYTGATIKHLTGQDLARYSFALPPIDVQRRIVDVLDGADALRAKRRAALVLLDTLTQSIFLDIFGDPATNPRRYPMVAIGELLDSPPIFGTMIPAEVGRGTWLSLRVANIQNWTLDLRHQKYVELPDSFVLRHSVIDGDLLMARAIASQEHLGKAIVVYPGKRRWAFDSHLMRLRFRRERVVPEFVRELLMTAGGRSVFLKASRRSAVQFNINTKEISALRIPLPSLEMQSHFVQKLSAIESLKSSHLASLASLDALFASLQHRAFRGEL